jgi:DNA-3-methyladenine glycosylase II
MRIHQTTQATLVHFKDRAMQALLSKHGPAPFSPGPFTAKPSYATLVGSIVGQQVSGKAANAVYGRLEAKFSIEPAPIFAASFEELRSVGLSGAKTRYIQDLSRFALDGGLDNLESLDDQALQKHLVQVKGIGVWSVQMFLMFGLGRPDIWPVLDLGVRKGLEKTYGLDPGAKAAQLKHLEAFGERFRPYRSHAAWLMWRCLG